MASSPELIDRAESYAEHTKLQLGEQLGFGVHGVVFACRRMGDPGRLAIKVHERQIPYERERDVYLRLQQHCVTQVHGCHVPQLLAYDDGWLIIEMTAVTPPYVLDFAGAYLDRPPDFSEEILAEWKAEKQEQFGDGWPEVRRVLWTLEGHGIYVSDISPSNICLHEGS
ncbi:MAG: hypothetical protein NTY19_07000 [Planctomycetota bacterium]|nr:hypothetical protein [Planctomycetota bacterium]